MLATSIGKSKYCTLNLENDYARNLLENTHIEKRNLKITDNLQNLNREIKRLASEEPAILAAILHNNSLLIVLSDKLKSRLILKNTALPNISFVTPKELQAVLLKSLDILDGIILFGADRLFLIVEPIHKQLMLNHSTLFRRGNL